MLPKDGGPNYPNPLVAHDVMSDNLLPYISTIQFWTQNESPVGSGKFDGNWVAVTSAASGSGQPWSYTPLGPHEIDFYLPNGTPIKITYNALVDANVGDTATIYNTISIEGYESSDGDTFEVNDSGAGAGGSRAAFTVFKENENHERLSGAQFDLFIAFLPSYDYYGPAPATEMLTVTGADDNAYDFYYLMTVTTDTLGTAVFDHSRINTSFDYLFLLVETRAPTGYQLPSGTDAYTYFVLPTVFDSVELDALEALFGDINLTTDNIIIENTKLPPTPPTIPPIWPEPPTPPTIPPTIPPTPIWPGGEGDRERPHRPHYPHFPHIPPVTPTPLPEHNVNINPSTGQ